MQTIFGGFFGIIVAGMFSLSAGQCGQPGGGDETPSPSPLPPPSEYGTCQFGEDWVDADGDGSPTCLWSCDDVTWPSTCQYPDCNDQDSATYPGAAELCDGLDNDCDNTVEDEKEDADLDGYTACTGDCDDSLWIVSPEEPEMCDEFDNNCDGTVNEGIPVDADCSTIDDDLDGVSEAQGDCFDYDETVYPGAPELCDGIDNDCDHQADEGVPCPSTAFTNKEE